MYHVVDRPFGFTAPASVADVGPTAVAWAVATIGAPCVVNAWSEPVALPASLVATRRKW